VGGGGKISRREHVVGMRKTEGLNAVQGGIAL
jgi:hypothetical protein